MNIEQILQASTHYEVDSNRGIVFYESDTCAECGATVHTNGSAWIKFDGITPMQCAIEAQEEYGMKRIKVANDCYYSEDTASNECCDCCS